MWEADPLRFLGRKAETGWTERLDLWNGCLTRHRLEPGDLPRRTTREKAALALYQAHAGAEPVRVIGEKSPYYADILPRLAHHFPFARFIIIHRNPAASIDSARRAAAGNRFFRAPWMPLRLVKDAGRLRRDAEDLKQRGHWVFELGFDELVAAPETTTSAIWSALGLDPRPERLCDPDPSLLPPGDHHRLAKQMEVDSGRADGVRPSLPAARRHRLREEHRESGRSLQRGPAEWLLPARDEIAYQAIRGIEGMRRIAFRHLPLGLLKRHRRTSGHRVASPKPQR